MLIMARLLCVIVLARAATTSSGGAGDAGAIPIQPGDEPWVITKRERLDLLLFLSDAGFVKIGKGNSCHFPIPKLSQVIQFNFPSNGSR